MSVVGESGGGCVDFGRLRSLFVGIASKRLSAVEVSPTRSHQHELNGVNQFKAVLGDHHVTFPTTFHYLDDDDENVSASTGTITWYDSRARHPTRSEWRAYFTDNAEVGKASPGDSLVLARKPDDSLLALICPAGSTAERQVHWLFGVTEADRTTAHAIDERTPLGPAARLILANLGIDIDEGWSDASALEEMRRRFPDDFPTTSVFSAWAREVAGLQPGYDPDEALLDWFTTEERLFKLLEREFLERKIQALMDRHGVDVDRIFDLMKSAGQRRKSRAGAALENHLEQVFKDAKVRFSAQPKTEGKARPDFIFPGIVEYRDPAFDDTLLKMLAAKSTARDRWRQVLTEAKRVKRKHLLTLEPAISSEQLNDMDTFHVMLVVPEPIHVTYGEDQNRLTTLRDFVAQVGRDQNA